MKKKAEQLLAKAQDAIEAAELLLGGGKNTFAVGRAYFLIFAQKSGGCILPGGIDPLEFCTNLNM